MSARDLAVIYKPNGGTANRLIIYTDQYVQSSFDNPYMTWQGGRTRDTKNPLAKVNGVVPEGRLFGSNFIAHNSWFPWPSCADGGTAMATRTPSGPANSRPRTDRIASSTTDCLVDRSSGTTSGIA